MFNSPRGHQVRMVGRAARQTRCYRVETYQVAQVRSLHQPPRGRSSMAELLPSKQTTRVRFSLPAPASPRSSSGRGHRSFKSANAGSNAAGGTTAWPLRLAGRAPGFDLGRLGSNPRGAAISTARNSSVGRAGVSYAPSAAGFDPCFRDQFRRLSQVGRQRVVAPS